MIKITQEQIEYEKQVLKANIELGESIKRLQTNTDFQNLIQYLENKFNKVSMEWAISNKSEYLPTMQSLLYFKNELINISAIAEKSRTDVKLIQDLENDMED